MCGKIRCGKKLAAIWRLAISGRIHDLPGRDAFHRVPRRPTSFTLFPNITGTMWNRPSDAW